MNPALWDKDFFYDGGFSSLPPDDVMYEVGMNRTVAEQLAVFNDVDKLTFSDIADYIERFC